MGNWGVTKTTCLFFMWLKVQVADLKMNVDDADNAITSSSACGGIL